MKGCEIAQIGIFENHCNDSKVTKNKWWEFQIHIIYLKPLPPNSFYPNTV